MINVPLGVCVVNLLVQFIHDKHTFYITIQQITLKKCGIIFNFI